MKTRSKLTQSLALVMLLMMLPSGCREERAVGFRPLGVANGPVIKQNEAILVRFTKPISQRSVHGRNVRVRVDGGTGSGQALLLAHGRVLRIEPPTAEGWKGHVVEIEVVHPAPLPLETPSGEPHTEGLRHRFEIADGFQDVPGHMMITHTDLSGITSVDPAAPFAFGIAFDAPIDPATYQQGIRVIDLKRGAQLEAPEIVARVRDPRRLLVAPFKYHEGLFNGGTRYEVRITPALRSLDGRQLLREERLYFETRRGTRGVLQFKFDDASHLASPSDSPAVATGALVPRIRQDTVPVGTRSDANGDLFVSEGRRIQVLIAGDRLAGLGACAIREVFFESPSEIPSDAEVEDLAITMGYLPVDLERGGVLSPTFARNLPHSKRMHLVGGSSTVRLRSSDPQAGRRVIALRFAEPFPYDPQGLNRSLVIELQCPFGVRSALYDPVPYSISVVGGEGKNRMLWAPPSSQVGHESPFVPQIWLSAERFPEVVSAWQIVDEAIVSPTFEFNPRDRDLVGTHLDERFVSVLFQGGIPVGLDDVEPDGTRWYEHAYALPLSTRAVRVKVVFNPHPDLLDIPEDRQPKISLIRVRYRDQR